MGAGNEGGGLADGLPLQIREQVAVLMTDSAPHRGSGQVCGRNTNAGVVPAVREGPEDALRIFDGAVDRSRLKNGSC